MENQIQCPDHKEHKITHFCTFKGDVRQLCPLCIMDQQQLHQFQNMQIVIVDQIKSQCQDKVRDAIQFINNERLNLESQNQYYYELQQQIQKHKIEIEIVVQLYFQNLNQMLEQKMNQLQLQFENIEKKLQNQMNDFLQLREGLQSDSMRQIDSIKQIFGMDINKLIQQTSSEIRKQNKLKQQIQLKINKGYKESLKFHLDQYIQLKDFSVKEDHTYQQEQYDGLGPSKLELSSSQEYFDLKNCTYGIPQFRGQYMHFVDLGDQQFKSYKFHLKNEFEIPKYHSSIITPNGKIYMIGGVESTSQDKSNKTFIFSGYQQKLIQCENMKFERSSHSLIYLNGYIYMIGGLDSKHQQMNKCERFCLENETWQTINSCQYPCTNPALCTFDNTFIYKFSPSVIEMYNSELNIWTEIDPSFESHDQNIVKNFQISQQARAIQINKNQIYVFGGFDLNNQSSEKSFVLTKYLDNDYQITINQFPLLYSFNLISNPYMIQNKIFVQANYKNTDYILSFYDEEWHIIEYQESLIQ